MNQNRLRLVIFCFWAAALFLSILAAELAPIVRHDGTLMYGDVAPLLPEIVALFLPALSCLAGFWFPTRERTKGSKLTLGRDRAAVAISLTAIYLVVVFVIVFWPIYVTHYPRLLDLPESETLGWRVREALKIATMLSPLALSPIHYLTSG